MRYKRIVFSFFIRRDMGKWGILLVFMLIGSLALAQEGYKKVYAYDEYQHDWAKVKTIAGTYGFIDRSRGLVVEPVYARIGKFNYASGQYALVKNVAGAYGFLDRQGREAIPAIHWKKADAIMEWKKREG